MAISYPSEFREDVPLLTYRPKRRTIDELASDGAIRRQRGRRRNDHRILSRHKLASVLLVRLPCRRSRLRVRPIAGQRWRVRARIDERNLPLQRVVDCARQ